MHIDSYSFGRIVIDGRTYTSDLIIYPDRVDASWWREEGHLLHKADLKGVIAARPDVLIVGTGAHGVMHVPEGTIRFLQSLGIEVHVLKTAEAVELYNKQPRDRRTVGALHLTC